VLDALGQILPSAIAVALSPVPIIAVILVLFSAKAATNGPAFLVGWVVGLAAVAAAAYTLADGADVAADPDAASSLGWGKILLGTVLVVLAGRQWRSRPQPGEDPPMPAWMSAIDSFTPAKAAGVGALLSAVNPKNLIITVAAAATVAQTGVTGGDAALVLAAFVLIASLSIGGPVLYRLVGGEEARARLDEVKAWLGRNNAAVMSVLLLVIGAKILGDGLGLA
jgi:hypothetical protein